MHASAPIPIERQWQIVISLMSRRQGQTIKELSSEVGVDDRTIRRDLKTLTKAGFPLSERVTEFGRKHWRMEEGGPRVPIHFTWSEAVALYLGRRLLDPLAGTEFWHSAQTAFNKIQAMLGEAALSQLKKVSKSFLQTMPGRSDYSEKSELIDRLMLAIEDHRIAFVAYQSERSTEPVSLELYPYGIVFHKGSLYLVAHSRDHEKQASEKRGLTPSRLDTNNDNSEPPGVCPPFSSTASEKRGQTQMSAAASLAAASAASKPRQPDAHARDLAASLKPTNAKGAVPFYCEDSAKSGQSPAASAIRHFKLDRVTDVDVQKLQFTPDPDFSLQKHLANSFGVYGADESESGHPKKIRIRFTSEAARYVQEKTWHPSQTLKKEKDGSVVLEVSLDTTHEIKSWALSFGPRATVLEPETLRNEIRQDLEAVLNSYQGQESRKTKSRPK